MGTWREGRGDPREGLEGQGVRAAQEELRAQRFVRIRHHRAHRPGYQVRSFHWHLRDGLLCALGPPRLAGAVPEIEARKDRFWPSVEEGGRHEVVPDQVRWHHSQLRVAAKIGVAESAKK